MKLQKLLPPVIGVVGTAIGIYLGRGPLAPAPDKAAAGDLVVSGSILQGSPLPASIDTPSTEGAVTPGATNRKGSPVADALLGIINNPDGQAALNQFYLMLGRMPSQEIADLIVDVDNYPNHSRRRETREMIIDYLAMADPMKALEVHRALPNRGIFDKAFRQLGRSDPDEALRVRDDLEDANDRSNALTSIFVGASEIDPARAFELLKKTGDAGPQHYHEVFDNWAELDPEMAARMALTVEKSAERREALKIVGQEWAERDPESVLAWVDATELTSFERETIRSSALSAYARRDAKAAMDLLAGLDASTRNRALPGALSALMNQDPDAAIAWIREEPDGFAKFRALDATVYNLANQAPEATIDLAKEYPEIKDRALANAFGSLATHDLAQALEKAQEWKDDPQYANIMQQIASGYSRSNPEEALKWANGLDENIRSSAVSSAISRLSNDDPDLAIKHLGDLGLRQEDPVYQQAIQQIAGQWASQDPLSAAEWIDSLADPDLHTQAVGDVADRWARIDPVSASEWISDLPAGAARDQAAYRLINRIEREDPEMAAAWAGSIADENTRNNAFSSVFSQWMRMDPAGAQAAIEASPLPDAMKEQHLRRLDGVIESFNQP